MTGPLYLPDRSSLVESLWEQVYAAQNRMRAAMWLPSEINEARSVVVAALSRVAMLDPPDSRCPKCGSLDGERCENAHTEGGVCIRRAS